VRKKEFKRKNKQRYGHVKRDMNKIRNALMNRFISLIWNFLQFQVSTNNKTNQSFQILTTKLPLSLMLQKITIP
jgi:hypothetical protein